MTACLLPKDTTSESARLRRRRRSVWRSECLAAARLVGLVLGASAAYNLIRVDVVQHAKPCDHVIGAVWCKQSSVRKDTNEMLWTQEAAQHDEVNTPSVRTAAAYSLSKVLDMAERRTTLLVQRSREVVGGRGERVDLDALELGTAEVAEELVDDLAAGDQDSQTSKKNGKRGRQTLQ